MELTAQTFMSGATQVPAGKEAQRWAASPLPAGAPPRTPEARAPLPVEGGIGMPSPSTPTRSGAPAAAGYGTGTVPAAAAPGVPNSFQPAAQAAPLASDNPFTSAPAGKMALTHSHSAKSDYVDATEHY